MYRDSDGFRCAFYLPNFILYIYFVLFLLAPRSLPLAWVSVSYLLFGCCMTFCLRRSCSKFQPWTISSFGYSIQLMRMHSRTHCQSTNPHLVSIIFTLSIPPSLHLAHMHTQTCFCARRFLHEINLIDKLQNVKLMSDIGIALCALCYVWYNKVYELIRVR